MKKRYHLPTCNVIVISIEHTILKGSVFEVDSGTTTVDADNALTNKKNPIWGEEQKGPWD